MDHRQRSNASEIFHREHQLRDFMEEELPRLFAELGTEVMVLGKEVSPGPGCRIDLLLLDANAQLCAVELKLGKARPDALSQAIAYRRAIKSMSRQDVSENYAAAGFGDLVRDFEHRFGTTMPAQLTGAKATIVAASFEPRVIENTIELSDEGLAIDAYTYAVGRRGVSLKLATIEVPFTVSTSIRELSSWSTRMNKPPVDHQPSYKPRSDLQWFWDTHRPIFRSPIITSGGLYQRYVEWIERDATALRGRYAPLQWGQFGRGLRTLMARAGVETRIYLPPGTAIDPFSHLDDLPPASQYPTAGFTIVAYHLSPRSDR